MTERARLAAQQAKLIAQLALETELPFKRPDRPTQRADYKSIRGLPAIGPAQGIHRAAAGVTDLDQAERNRITTARRRAGTSSRIKTTNDLLNDNDNRCYLCHQPINILNCHVDHIIPLTHGGEDTDTNLAVTCPTCNLRKGSRYVAVTIATRKPVYIA